MLLALALATQLSAFRGQGDPTLRPVETVTLNEIFARPEFAASRHRTGATLKVLLSRLEAWLESLFETSGAQTYSNVTRIVVLVLALLVAVAAVLRFRARRRRTSRPGQPTPLTALPMALESPSVHLGRAKALLDTDPREAIRHGLYGLLSMLEQRRWARPDRVKTNRELATELPASGAPSTVATSVARMLAWYDSAFYSKQPVSRPEAQHFIDQIHALEPAP